MTPNKLNTEATPQSHTLEALKQLIPACFTEVKNEQGELQQVVDWDALKQLLGENIADENHERYQFTWAGKQGARLEANKATSQTLRPVPEDSVDWDTTENLYIEGDNLQVLKLLQQGYMGKVKMIYIDPPYNTGNDFVYDDDFARSQAEEDLDSGDIDEEGNRYRKNNRTNGRFHSDWCSMIYPRLLIARSLLTEDGVIFISIDDNEVHNLRKICDEVFGEGNFVAELPTIMNLKGNQDQFGFAGTHEYTLVYAKNKDNVIFNDLPVDEEEAEFEWSIDNVGYFKQGAGLVSTGTNSPRDHRPKLWYPIFVKEDNSIFIPPVEELNKFYDTSAKIFNDEYLYKYIDKQEKAGVGIAILPRVKGREASWRWGSERVRTNPNEIIVNRSKSSISLYKKQRPEIGDLPSKKPKTLFYKPEYSSGNGTRELENIFKAERFFTNPKPLGLLFDLIQISSNPDSLILDFFSGSATTAHAVMQLNVEDGGKRKYICVQLNEATPENSEARKAGYASIPEIAKERIRRAGQKIKAENPTAQDLDMGFRVLRLADSNFNEVNRHPNEYDQVQLDLFATNIKEDRNDLDLLFGAMLSWGVPLSLPISTEEIDGCRLYNVNDGDLVACFAENVSEAVVKAMASKVSLRVLFRDSCFSEDKHKINIFEIFKQHLGWDEKEAMDKIRVI
ncbi:site-specific DNA-methyltransferase [Capnocytophaga sputigena]|jgi:type III restriction-modification system ecoPI, modification subunit